MNNTRSKITPLYRLPLKTTYTAVLLAFIASTAAGQTAPTPPPPSPAPTADNEIVELTPFVIEASSEVGWVATESLAGSRMKTQIKDLAQPLEVMTTDFMNDMGINNFEQALIYSTNIEGRNELTQGDGLGMGVFQPRNNTRIRGLITATTSRNFFASQMPTDNYNLDRITIARGPNAILFGLGSPSGIVDVSLQRANLQKQTTRLEAQVNSESGRRSSINFSQPLIKNKLAIRVAATSSEEVTNSKPNLDRQDRYYGVITAKPFTNTTLSLHAEKVSRMSNRAPRILQRDAWSIWETASSVPGSLYTSDRPLFDNRTTGAVNPGNTLNATNTTLTNVNTNNPIFLRSGNYPVMLFGAGALDGAYQNWNNAVEVREPQQQLPNGLNTSYNFTPFNVLDRINFNNTPERIMPYDVNIYGTARKQKLTGDLYNLFFEQKIADNLFFEFAYNKEKLDEKTADSGFVGNNTIFVDANQYLPGTSTPNPNAGRYYVQGRANGSQFWEAREDWRATLSYEFDFGRKYSSGFAHWLGKHRLAGMASNSDYSRKGHQLQRGIINQNIAITGSTLPTGSVGIVDSGNATTPGATGTRFWATNAQRDFVTRFYLGGPDGNSAKPVFGDVFKTFNFTDANGNPFGAYLFDSPYTNADGKHLVRTGSGPEGTFTRDDTQMLAWQGYFLKDRLILLYGYRKDKAKSKTIAPEYQSAGRDYSGLYISAADAEYGQWGINQNGITRTLGAVYNITDWAALNFSKSDAFQPNIGKYSPYGYEYPGATGKGQDMGLSFGFFNRKLIMRLSRYTNTAHPSRAGNNLQDPYRDQLWNIEENLRLLDPTIPTIGVGSGGYRDKGRANYWIMSDSEAKGYELEISYLPTPNWSFILNAAKNEAVDTAIGTDWLAWMNERLPIWQTLNVPEGGKSAPSDINGDGVIGTWTWDNAPWDRTNQATSKTFASYFNEDISSQTLPFLRAAEGRARDMLREYRSNLIIDYKVTEGRLKGLGTNLAFRYRSAPVLAYGARTLDSGGIGYDTSKPIKGTQELLTDVGLRYQGRIKFFGDLNYRAQLNVRNLLNKTDLEPIAALTTGQYVGYSRIEPRTYQFTLTLDY